MSCFLKKGEKMKKKIPLIADGGVKAFIGFRRMGDCKWLIGFDAYCSRDI